MTYAVISLGSELLYLFQFGPLLLGDPVQAVASKRCNLNSYCALTAVSRQGPFASCLLHNADEMKH